MFRVGIRFDNYPEKPAIKGSFSRVLGIEGEQTCGEEYIVELLDGSVDDDLAKDLQAGKLVFEENLYLCVLGKEGNILGEYFFSQVEVIEYSCSGDLILNLKCQGVLYPASIGSMKCWEMISQGEVEKNGAWKKLKEEELQGWLEVALNYKVTTSDKAGLVVELDGSEIKSINEFYCALGEAVNGYGGYFGRNLDALCDCFCGDFGVKEPMSIVWHNASKGIAYKSEYEEFLANLKEVFEENNVSFKLVR